MAAWPEFYFDSEFESASDMPNVADQLMEPCPAAVQLSMYWNPVAESYKRSYPALSTVKRQPPIITRFQNQLPFADKRRHPNAESQPSADQSKPPIGVQKTASSSSQSQPARKQPPNGFKPPDYGSKRQLHSQSQRQPPMLKRQPLLLKGQPQMLKKQPPVARSQPPFIQPQAWPPIQPPRRQPQDGTLFQSQTPAAEKSSNQPPVGVLKQPLKVGVQSQPRPRGQPPDVQAPDLPPDPKTSVRKEDWGKGSFDPG